MRNKSLSLLILAGLLVACSGCMIAAADPVRPRPMPPPPPPPRGYAEFDVGVFYDDLAPYGDWFRMEPYGWVWTPYDVRPEWRPYTVGRWLWTDDGWTWMSDEPWGWAAYHYGRWFFDSVRGWIWVPGREWAPAWVAWRRGGGYVGWAPLPPRVTWRAGIGFDFGGVDVNIILEPWTWGFVPEYYLCEPRMASRVILYPRNVTIVRETHHVTNYVIVQNRIVNRSVDVVDIERVSRKAVPRYRIVDDDSADVRKAPRVRGQEVRVFRPELREAPPERAPRVAVTPAQRPPVAARAGEAAPRTPPAPPSQTAPRDVRDERATPPVTVEERRPISDRQADAERRRLERKQTSDQKKLTREQVRETKQPPPGMSAEDLRTRHEAEKREATEQAQREKKLLESKIEREKEKGRPDRVPPSREKSDKKKTETDRKKGG